MSWDRRTAILTRLGGSRAGLCLVGMVVLLVQSGQSTRSIGSVADDGTIAAGYDVLCAMILGERCSQKEPPREIHMVRAHATSSHVRDKCISPINTKMR